VLGKTCTACYTASTYTTCCTDLTLAAACEWLQFAAETCRNKQKPIMPSAGDKVCVCIDNCMEKVKHQVHKNHHLMMESTCNFAFDP
jgi:hypothetical protein